MSDAICIGYRGTPLARASNNNGYDTIRYDSVYLTCSKKLTGRQLSLPHGINKKLKCKTKNIMMSVIGPVQSRYREAVQKVKEIYGGKDLLKR